ncbi:triosephosphate isomerase [Kytococcus aerolatus]|uniref:Triosephosphate isomerase n=1 Tax=Kytococcus aerolatus TaxID=592308 RepID=A0A212T0E5_9MICO|nr:triose-phosphate isomerase [Kytococcus aerolatus]SNC59489.1 triosephosphate isomerase [Kytococcus aerolatus]
MSGSRIPLIAGNWKMNLDHLQATHLVQKLDWVLRDASHAYDEVEVAVFPPFTHLRSVETLIQADQLEIMLGAQDLSQHASGAHTGDISGPMLAKLGCEYVIIGHSERREQHQETDALVNLKVKAALAANLAPVICVGESLATREAGEHIAFVTRQVDEALEGIEASRLGRAVIAYEPVWAIGTGAVASAEDAQEVCAEIRQRVAHTHGQELADGMRILYGGSVKPASIAELMDKEDVDGALVGGASLTAEEFAQIIRFRSHRPA